MRLLIHGGAGTLKKAELTPQQEKEFHAALRESLLAGHKMLKEGCSSLHAVAEAIRILEDSPLFNAGYGSVITRSGTIELDAAIMEGKSLKAGAVAGVSHVKNPIILALKILENSEHLMLIGESAEIFGETLGIEKIPAETHITPKQLEKWKKFQKYSGLSEYEKHGTVGAVALDLEGNLAAGTSTGGMMNKIRKRSINLSITHNF